MTNFETNAPIPQYVFWDKFVFLGKHFFHNEYILC